MMLYATRQKVAGSIPDVIGFLIDLILPVALWPASNRNEYQESSLE
jgi:hypothetical protein